MYYGEIVKKIDTYVRPIGHRPLLWKSNFETDLSS